MCSEGLLAFESGNESKIVLWKKLFELQKVIPEEECQECNVNLEYDHTDAYRNMLLLFSLFGAQ